MSVEVVGRTGRMENGEYVVEVTLKIVDGDVTTLARGPSEKEAEAAGRAEIARFRAEQEALNTPDVAALRALYADAIRQAKENLGVD